MIEETVVIILAQPDREKAEVFDGLEFGGSTLWVMFDPVIFDVMPDVFD
jgi:hypothetical protein